MAQTFPTPQGPMVLIDAKTRKLAPASVVLGPNGTPPPGYALSSWYLNDQNWLTDARTDRNLAPIGNVGTPGATQPSGGFSMNQPTFGGVERPDIPDWWPEWLEPPTFGGTPTTPMPPSPPPGGVTPQPEGDQSDGPFSRIGKFFKDPENLLKLGGVVTALAAGMRGGGGGGGSSPDVQQLNAITEQRMRRVDPLHQAVTQLAWGRLPTSSRQGIAPPTNTPLP